MKKRILLCVVTACLALCATAQSEDKYVISGEMTRDSLRFTPQQIKKLYLKHIVNGEERMIDSTTVRNGHFRFEGKAPTHTEAGMITGFDNGAVQFLLEAGNIQIKPFDGHFPVGAKASGTPSNDVYEGYLQLYDKNATDSKKNIERLKESLPDSIKNNEKAFIPYHSAAFHANSVYYKIDVLQYFRQHLDNPAALFIIKYDLWYLLTPQNVDKMLMQALHPSLRQHPIYAELQNKIRSANLKEGAPAPDITGLTPEGKTISLSDLKGKYVLLDVWASWCGPCRREFPHLKQVLADTEASGKFAVLSYSIDSKNTDWTQAIEKNGLTHPNWIHISTLKGWQSDAVELYSIKGVPYTALIDPEGNVVAFNLRGEDMQKKVKSLVNTNK